MDELDREIESLLSEQDARLFGNVAVARESWVRSLREFNPCHSPESGQFTGKGEGDCEHGSTEHREKHRQLKAEWARINNEQLEYLDRPDHPAAQELTRQLLANVKAQYDLDADVGGVEGIGEPGGARDVVIIGAGPGGLSAAMMAGAEGYDTLYIDSTELPGGQSKHSSRIENYPGFPIGVTGQQLAQNAHNQAQRMGAEAMLGVSVVKLTHDKKTGLKTITLSNGKRIRARSVILAGGVSPRILKFPGSDDMETIVYMDAERIARESHGKPVVIIGGSNGAAQAALEAARKSNQVVVVARSPLEKGMSDYQITGLRNHPKIKVIEEDEVGSLSDGILTTKRGVRIAAHRVGMFIGGNPNTKWLPKTVKIDRETGTVKVDGNLETSMPGVFAIGDIRQGGGKRIGTAVGDGQTAISNIFGYFGRQPQSKAFRRRSGGNRPAKKSRK